MASVTVSSIDSLKALTKEGQNEFRAFAKDQDEESDEDDNGKRALGRLAHTTGLIQGVDLETDDLQDYQKHDEIKWANLLSGILTERQVLSLSHNTTNYEPRPELNEATSILLLENLKRNEFLCGIELGFEHMSSILLITLGNLFGFQNNLTRLQLAFDYWSPENKLNSSESYSFFADSFANLSGLKQLDIHGIDPICATLICKTLFRSTQLESLLLAVKLDIKSEFIQELSLLLNKLPRLTSLELHHCGLNDDSFPLLLSSIEERDGEVLWHQGPSLMTRKQFIRPNS